MGITSVTRISSFSSSSPSSSLSLDGFNKKNNILINEHGNNIMIRGRERSVTFILAFLSSCFVTRSLINISVAVDECSEASVLIMGEEKLLGFGEELVIGRWFFF